MNILTLHTKLNLIYLRSCSKTDFKMTCASKLFAFPSRKFYFARIYVETG